jgi:hypothetical protein
VLAAVRERTGDRSGRHSPVGGVRWVQRGVLPPLHDLARLLARPLPELEDEPSATGRHHDEPTARVGSVRLDRAWRTEATQRSRSKSEPPLGALDDMVDLGDPSAAAVSTLCT